jgi:hypothetical protein
MISEKDPTEELRDLAKIFEQINKDDLLNMFVETMCLYGNYVEGFGRIHKKYGKVFELAKDFTKTPISPELMGYVADKATPEMAGIFLKIMLKLASIAPQMSRFMDLTSEEKIKLGKGIKSLAKDFENLKGKEL